VKRLWFVIDSVSLGFQGSALALAPGSPAGQTVVYSGTLSYFNNLAGSAPTIPAQATVQIYGEIGSFVAGDPLDSSLAGLLVAEVFGPFTYKILYEVNPSGSWTSSINWFGGPGCGPAAPNVICSGNGQQHITDWKFSFAWEIQPATPSPPNPPPPTLPPQGTTGFRTTGTTGTVTTGK
jgi:hypothetical protein